MRDESGLSPWRVCEAGTVNRYVFDVPTTEQKDWLHWTIEQPLLYRLTLGRPNQENRVEILSRKSGLEPDAARPD